jgi:hypothetical protein
VLLNDVSPIVASTGTPATLPSPDGVDQFRVITTNAAAEYGHTSGAVISVNTISGTNTYHGNLYFLLRNEALDANSTSTRTPSTLQPVQSRRVTATASFRKAAPLAARSGYLTSTTDATKLFSSSTTTALPPPTRRL